MQRAEELMRYFSTVHQSVVGFDSKYFLIFYANPAAVSAFGFNPVGKPAKELINGDIYENTTEDYACSATVNGRKASISVVNEKDFTLLIIDFLEANGTGLSITRYMISSLRNNAMGIKMSADRLFSALEDGKAPVEKNISVFYHYYYSLLRTLINIDSADLIQRGELLFSPVATDLVRLCSELTDTVHLFCSEFGVDISFSSEERELVAVVDPARIEQLLLNLFANSLKHTSAGNSIALSLSRAGNSIVISLNDDGEGIPPEVMSNIFKVPEDKACADLRQAGDGLGLYIAFGIAQLHKGVLLVESRAGEGTHVRVMLPADESPSPKFSCPDVSYRHTGASTILSLLSDVLPSSRYGTKYED